MTEKPRIIFVDDEINILNGLRRSLHKMSCEWDIEYVDSGFKAIDLMKINTYDIIVTDMRMPEITGIELLRYVYKHYPKMVRIILSGHTDRSVIMQSISIAHQFFSKPSNTEELISALKTIIYIRKRLNDSELIKTISQLKSIPVLPSIYHELIEIIRSDDASLKDIGDLIEKDIGLSTKILQLVNSSFFSVMKRITEIHQAINLLGLTIIKDVVLSFNLFNQIDEVLLKTYHLEELWIHSLYTANICRYIAKDLNLAPEKIEIAFISGIMHDIGRLILVSAYPDDYQKVLDLVKIKKYEIVKAEDEVLGISHNVVAAYLCSLWGFSGCVIESIYLHHSPNIIKNQMISVVTCVHIANYIHHVLSYPDDLANFVNIEEPVYDKEYLGNLGLEAKLEEYIEYFKEQKIVVFDIY